MSTSSSVIFAQCINAQNISNQNNVYDSMKLLECVTYNIEQSQERELQTHFPRGILLVFAAALIFIMQAGFAMVCAGAVRKKNVQNTMLKNLLDACGASVAFFSVGYAFAFGGMMEPNPSLGKTFMGTTNFFMINVTDYAFWLFQYAFSATSTTIVAGTLAERCQMAAYLCYSVVLSGWVYPIVAHSVWSINGFLSATAVNPLFGCGMVDFAGSGVVHVTGGITALFATIILGPRRGRFHDDTGRKLDTPNPFPGHSAALQMLGTLLLWFGWYGFNSGSALLAVNDLTANKSAALAAVNSTLSAGVAGITALLLNLIYLERTTGEAYFDLIFAMNGCLAGLVSITGGCGVVEPFAAVIIGTFAGCFYVVGSYGLLRLHLDDAVDAIPVHLVCGIWGVISTGLFASPRHLAGAYSPNHGNHPGLFYSWANGNSNANLLGAQLVGLLFIMSWVLFIMLPFFIWLDWKGWFRSDPLEEIVGLDLSYHGGFPLLHAQNGGDDVINPDYLSAYKKRKEEDRSTKMRNRGIERHPYAISTQQGRSSTDDLPIDANNKNDDDDSNDDDDDSQFETNRR